MRRSARSPEEYERVLRSNLEEVDHLIRLVEDLLLLARLDSGRPLARDHVDAINRDGLRLSGAGATVGRLRATTDAGEIPPCDFGIVATKAMHTEPAIAATAPAFADGAVASRGRIVFGSTIRSNST